MSARYLLATLLYSTWFFASPLATSLGARIRQSSMKGNAKVAMISTGHPELFNLGKDLVPNLSLNRSNWGTVQFKSGDRIVPLGVQSNSNLPIGMALDGCSKERFTQRGAQSEEASRVKFLAVRLSIAKAIESLGFAPAQEFLSKTKANVNSYMSSFSGTKLKEGEVVGFIHSGTTLLQSRHDSISGTQNRGHTLSSCENFYVEARAQFRQDATQLQPLSTLDGFIVHVGTLRPLKAGVFPLNSFLILQYILQCTHTVLRTCRYGPQP